MSDEQTKAAAEKRTLKGMLLEMKLAPTSEERILAEELIVNHFARTAKLTALMPSLVKSLDSCVEVLEFAYMNAPKQPKEIEQAYELLARIEQALVDK